MNAKLTETQTAVLNAATSQPGGKIEPLPTNLRGSTRTQVIKGLLAKGLVVESEGCHLLTDAGYAAVGKRRPIPKGVQKMDTHALQKLEVTSRTIRPGGTTIAQMMADTGWQAHSVRGAISGMVKKRLGYAVVTEKGADGQRTYRIV